MRKSRSSNSMWYVTFFHSEQPVRGFLTQKTCLDYKRLNRVKICSVNMPLAIPEQMAIFILAHDNADSRLSGGLLNTIA